MSGYSSDVVLNLHYVDIAIIICYLLMIVFVGVLASKIQKITSLLTWVRNWKKKQEEQCQQLGNNDPEESVDTDNVHQGSEHQEEMTHVDESQKVDINDAEDPHQVHARNEASVSSEQIDLVHQSAGSEREQIVNEGINDREGSMEHHRKSEDGKQKTNSSSIETYFLGGNELPWWALAASGMSSNLDVSGTMINAAMIYSMGVRGALIELRGGLTMVLSFSIFIGKWLRRSDCMTQSEWMALRFGKTLEGHFARLSTAIVLLILGTGSITYFSVGSGKFVAEFLSLPSWLGIRPDIWASLMMIVLAMIYTVASGLEGVVWTDVFQGGVIFLSIIIMCAKALISIPKMEQSFSLSVPISNGSFYTYNTTWSDWSSPFPKWSFEFPENSPYAAYNMFGVAISMYFIKMLIEGFGGPNGYSSQRFFAAKNERDASKMPVLWIFLLSFRWPFIIAVCMVGIHYGVNHSVIEDPEVVLPKAISLLPTGMKGLVIAAMISAGMSTFDSIVNATSSIWVKDIYHAYIHKSASSNVLLWNGRISSIIIVAVGFAFTLLIRDINEIWAWLTMSLSSGLIIPLGLRWYYWRINGYGYGFACIIGALASIILKFVFLMLKIQELPEYMTFFFIGALTFIACIVISFCTPRTNDDVLLKFFAKTRPFGLWSPYSRRVKQTIMKKVNKENIMDFCAFLCGMPWQLGLFFLWMALVMRTWIAFGLTFVMVTFCTLGLYLFWFKNLQSEEMVHFKDEMTIYEGSENRQETNQ